MIVIDADVGGVVKDLKRLDPCLEVRFAEHGNPPYFVVFWRSEDGCDTYLVKTVQAHQNMAGVWEGLDQRLVRELEAIDPHGRGGYDYAKALERNEAERKRRNEQARAERFGELSEQAAAAVRRDLGIKRRVFVP